MKSPAERPRATSGFLLKGKQGVENPHPERQAILAQPLEMTCNSASQSGLAVMPVQAILSRFTLGALCLAAAGALAPAAADSAGERPDTPARTSLETPYGTLAVRPSDYLYGATLTFNHTPTVPRLQGILNIPYAYVIGEREVALVSEDKGQADCQVFYYWVVMQADGYRITGPFGSCSPDIRLSTHGRWLRLETPDREKAGHTDRWDFDGNRLRKRVIPR